MPFNGSGTYNLYTPGNPVVTGTVISSTVQNNTMSDVATALTNCVTRDGQSPATASLPMGNNKITGLANGTATTDAAAFGQIQNSATQYATTTGTNTILLTLTPALASYSAGLTVRFIAAASNTGACTVNVNSVGGKALNKRMSGGLTALVANDIIIGLEYSVTYDGTEFLLNEQRPYAQGADVASATTTVLDTTTGDYIHITGTTAITAITLAQGEERTIEFTGILTFTNGASLILPSGANITTAAGDTCIVRGEASGVVRCVSYTKASGAALVVASLNLSGITNSLSGDVSLNNTSNYFDGPSIAQGATGTWFVSGTVTVEDTAGSANISAKLWDGTTVIASTQLTITNANFPQPIALSGYLATPAGNLRISVKDTSNTTGKIMFNASGNSKDSTISAFRIA